MADSRSSQESLSSLAKFWLATARQQSSKPSTCAHCGPTPIWNRLPRRPIHTFQFFDPVQRRLSSLPRAKQFVYCADEGRQLFLSQDEKTVSKLNATVRFRIHRKCSLLEHDNLWTNPCLTVADHLLNSSPNNYIPVLSKHSVFNAHNICGNPVHSEAEVRKSSVHDDKIPFSHNRSVLIFESRWKALDEIEQALTTGSNVRPLLDVLR